MVGFHKLIPGFFFFFLFLYLISLLLLLNSLCSTSLSLEEEKKKMSAVGQLLGGSFLSAFLQVAFERFASPELLDFLLRWEIDLDEVESLKRTSAMIQALSDEAEVKQFTNVAVKLWLDHLKQLLYDAEDILDEYATELLRLKLESANQTQQVRNPSVPLTPSSQTSSVSSWLNSGMESAIKSINQTLEGIQSIGPKVCNIAEELRGIKRFRSEVKEINQRLKSVAQEGVALGLNSSMGFGYSRPVVFSQRPPSSSLVNKYKVFGREEDMEKIVGWLLSDKTPCPSDNNNNFSVLPIVGMGGVGKTTLAQLVYNDERVKKHFHLKAWVCVSEDFDVVRLTKEILESATGASPLSNSLDMLHLKLQEALSEKRFLLVLDDVWNENYERWDTLSTTFAFGSPGSKILITTRNKGVASIVRTAPNDHCLKGLSEEACFSLIRRHAFMDENTSAANQKLEVFGHEIVKKCKGLPLAVKTLAGLLRDKRENNQWKAILENEIWDLRENEILPSLMLSYYHLPPLLKRCFAYCALFPKDYVFSKIEIVVLWMAEGIVQPEGIKRLEDIAGSPIYFFPTMQFKFQFLRVLRFRNCCNCELPDSVGKLKHLRLLDLSFSDIVKLPDSIGSLYNLQSLVLSGCGRLKQLPEDMGNLVNLRILIFPRHWCFRKIPLGVGNLTNLESLGTLDAGPKQKLSQLRGTLDNSNLENLGNNGAEAMVARQHLLGLQLHKLTSLRYLQISICENLELLSKALYTLTSLRRLVIESCPDLVSFRETRLPTSLQELKIFDCENLRSLPKELHTLMSLKEFAIDSCPALVSFQETRLPTMLEELEIIDCENLKSLPMGLLHNLTSFQRLEIKECPALESIPDMELSTALCEVSILNCAQLNCFPKGLNKLTNLKQLEIVDCFFLMECKNLEPLHTFGLHNLIYLSYLTIGGCRALLSIPNGLLPTNLQDFCIKDCPILESLYDGLSDLTSLKCLEIHNCPKLTPRYQKKEGEEWSKIAQIPKVIIDGIWQ
ncbi:disease resistance protein RGA2-like isoform X4 [Macadamia integrifolia]|uniref:disease resistance protein RGA2-like isoform X4 n=1 Tax=Macadamia integrifolia TaxID=60698 RepID=UPI001C533D61|nr:disease resistance protein RGA2-like isoform X4 [Macadamia integrifolia]